MDRTPGRVMRDEEYAWTPRQREVLDLVARGRSNQEIADALGISLDGAKWHMREVLSKLDVATREEAADYWRRRNGLVGRLARAFTWPPGFPPLLRIGAGAVAVATVGSGFYIWSLRGDDIEAPGAQTATPTAAGAPVLVIRDGREMFDLGQFFEVDGEAVPVAEAEAREALAVLSLKGEGRLRLVNESVGWRVYGQGGGILSMYAYVGANAYTMNVVGANDTVAFELPPASTHATFRTKNGERPVFMVQVFRGEGPYGTSDDRYHASVDANGHLFVSTSTIPDSIIVEFATGEKLDVTAAQALGTLGGRSWTHCEAHSLCVVTWSAGNSPLRALAAGSLACVDPQHLELHTGAFVLEFRSTGPAAPPAICTPGTSRSVSVGDDIGPAGGYEISARRNTGVPMSVAASRAGALFVGDIGPTVGCPCLGGV